MNNSERSAYPLTEYDKYGNMPKGLTKREAFAMAAMQGLLSDSDRGGSCEAYARDAIKFADALLKELDEARKLAMSEFNRCVIRKKLKDGYRIDCKMGCWGVTAPTKKEAEHEAKYYFSQYKLDGEYSSIIGGKNVVETLLEKGE